MTLLPIIRSPIPSGGPAVTTSLIVALRGLPRWRLRSQANGLAARLPASVAVPELGALAVGGGIMAIVVAVCSTIGGDSSSAPDPLAESNARTMQNCVGAYISC